MKRVEVKEIVIYSTDKSSRMAVASLESYERQEGAHTRRDRVVNWEDVRKAQRTIKQHMRAMNLIFRRGDNTGQPRV